HQQEDEEEDDRGAERDVHYGNTVRWCFRVRRCVVPSKSSTFAGRRHATFVGLTWNCMKSRKLCPCGMCPSVNSSWPSRLAWPSGLGSIVFIDWPSAQPGSRTRIAFLMSCRAVM